MTWKDKLEIGLKQDAPFRKDNLFPDQVHGPEIPAGPGRSPIIPAAVEEHEGQAEDTQAGPKPDTEKRPVEDLPPQD